MIDARFVYMERPANLPMRKAKFGVTYSRCLAHLERELKHLGAKQVTFQAGYRQVKNDGWPYASTRPEHPACTLQFLDRKGTQLTFKASAYSTFESNLRAITLTLEALRAVDRHGVVEGEQYAGFAQLPAPGAVNVMNKKSAARILASMAGWNEDQVLQDIPGAYRAAAYNAHPDRGGTHDVMAAVNEARKVLAS